MYYARWMKLTLAWVSFPLFVPVGFSFLKVGEERLKLLQWRRMSAFVLCLSFFFCGFAPRFWMPRWIHPWVTKNAPHTFLRHTPPVPKGVIRHRRGSNSSNAEDWEIVNLVIIIYVKLSLNESPFEVKLKRQMMMMMMIERRCGEWCVVSTWEKRITILELVWNGVWGNASREDSTRSKEGTTTKINKRVENHSKLPKSSARLGGVLLRAGRFGVKIDYFTPPSGYWTQTHTHIHTPGGKTDRMWLVTFHSHWTVSVARPIDFRVTFNEGQPSFGSHLESRSGRGRAPSGTN